MTAPASPWVLGARSETGYVRSANEDRMGWTRTAYGDVFVVSDGMGGYRGGALAAEIVVRTLQERLAAIPPDSPRFADHIRQAFDAANREVAEQRRADDPETREMGATAVAVVSRGARVIVAHVGDSRAYRWRARGGLAQLTRDHSRVQSMLDAGLITADEAAVHPEASVLERAIGPQPGVQPDVTDWLDLEPGDLLLLCSDGLCGYVPDADIEAVLRTQGTPQAMTDGLIEAALAVGGKDNVTVQLMRYAPPRGALGRLLARPAVLVPLCVGVTVVVVAGAWMRAADTQSRAPQSGQKKVDDAQRPGAAMAPTPMASAPTATAPAPPVPPAPPAPSVVPAPAPAAAARSSVLPPAPTPDMARAAAAIGQVKGGRKPAASAPVPSPPPPSARAPARSTPAPRVEPPVKAPAAATASRAGRSTPPAPAPRDGRSGAKKPAPGKAEAGSSAPVSVAPSAASAASRTPSAVAAPAPASAATPAPVPGPVPAPAPPPPASRPPPPDSPPAPSPSPDA